ncbi:MAG: TerB family tellurite resistance protein [Kiritimatiellae bacterium]|nr:TerB family tellurite resistance protein [Kiritimatiellia bacterium]
MGWFATGFGFIIGNAIGGPLGGVLGAVLANYLTKDEGEQEDPYARPGNGKRKVPPNANQRKRQAPKDEAAREMLFLGAAAAILAKLAKADGHITENEIASAEAAFARLGITGEKRDFCIDVFRQAKDDEHTVYEYADAFADAQPDDDIRVVFYDLLWDLAAADGILHREEKTILRFLPRHLRINPALYYAQYARRAADAGSSGREGGQSGGQSNSGRRRSTPRRAPGELAEAYAILGCAPTATDDELKKAYREKAKKLHPDEMMAQGLPPELVQKANDEMARVNAAYDRIRKARSA